MQFDSSPRNAERGGRARVITVTSGKGGVGKTNISTNLAIALAARGARVCLFDADTGMANVNVLLGHTPEYTLEHLLRGERTLEEILIEGPRGIHIVPAASGIAECADLDARGRESLLRALRRLERRYDYLLVDSAAGASAAVLGFIESAHYAVVVVTPEPTSLTNAFSLLKIMHNRGIQRPAFVLANQVAGHRHSLEIFSRFRAATRKYLKLDTYYLGFIQRDEAVTHGVRQQRPVVLLAHDAPASRCFYALAEAIGRHFADGDGERFSRFWAGRARAASPPATPVPLETPRRPAEEAAAALLQEVREGALDATRSRALLTPLFEAHGARFAAPPLDPRRALFSALEATGYPRDDIRYLVLTLEQLAEQHHRRPLHDTETLVARLLAGAGDDPQRLRELAEQLETGFRRRFDAPLFDTGRQLAEALRNGTLNERQAERTLQALQGAFVRRFGRRAGERGSNVHPIDRRILDDPSGP